MIFNFNEEVKKSKFGAAIEKALTVAADVLTDGAIAPTLEVNLAFLKEREIKKINKQFRDINEATDVLSFPFLLDLEHPKLIENELNLSKHANDINPATNALVLGDIYICLPIAKKQAHKYKHDLEKEVVFLAVHGLLHLFGYDHIHDEDRIVMRMREQQVMRALNLGEYNYYG